LLPADLRPDPDLQKDDVPHLISTEKPPTISKKITIKSAALVKQ
jgi:hypothetical protein